MDAVAEIGEPLVDDPVRGEDLVMLGVDETTWLSATRHHRTRHATRLVDLETLIDKAITACRLDTVAEIRAPGRTLTRWRAEILPHHTTGHPTDRPKH